MLFQASPVNKHGMPHEPFQQLGDFHMLVILSFCQSQSLAAGVPWKHGFTFEACLKCLTKEKATPGELFSQPAQRRKMSSEEIMVRHGSLLPELHEIRE